MTVLAEKTPTITLQQPSTPSLVLSAPVIQIERLIPQPARMVREVSLTPSLPVIEGTLLVYINGLLSTEQDQHTADDEVTLVYFTPTEP